MAHEILSKTSQSIDDRKEWIAEFHQKILAMDHEAGTAQALVPTAAQPTKLTQNSLSSHLDALVIGASTGGPRALLGIIRRLPAHLRCPILIVQHMPAGFTASFAKRLDTETTVRVQEAIDGMRIENQVYLCPGDYHMTIQQGHLQLDQRETAWDAPNRRLSFFLSSRLLWCATSGGRFNGDGKTAPLVYDRSKRLGAIRSFKTKKRVQFLGCRGMPLNKESLMKSCHCRILKQKLHRWSGEEDGRRICLI